MKTICAGGIAEQPPDPEYLEIGRSPIEQKEVEKKVTAIVGRCETMDDLRSEYITVVRDEGPDSLTAELLRMEGQMIGRKLKLENSEQ